MTNDELWPKVRSAPLTRDELRIIAERAQDCGADETIRQEHSTWALRAAMWQTLAQAAYACDALLARDELYAIWGEPPPGPGSGAKGAGGTSPPAPRSDP